MRIVLPCEPHRDIEPTGALLALSDVYQEIPKPHDEVLSKGGVE